MPNINFNCNVLDVIKKYNESENKRIEISGDSVSMFFDETIADRTFTESIGALKEYIKKSKREIKMIEKFLKDCGIDK